MSDRTAALEIKCPPNSPPAYPPGLEMGKVLRPGGKAGSLKPKPKRQPVHTLVTLGTRNGARHSDFVPQPLNRVREERFFTLTLLMCAAP